jgi:hypothetical protein
MQHGYREARLATDNDDNDSRKNEEDKLRENPFPKVDNAVRPLQAGSS